MPPTTPTPNASSANRIQVDRFRLEKDGFEVVGTRGSHCKLRRDDRTVIVPLHDEIAAGTLASILRAAGLTPEHLRELL
jgi:predicted RNA binding protein YcfA (HicA-like mRNA interferase family)